MRSTLPWLAASVTVLTVATACGAPPSDDPELILTGGLIYPLGADDRPVEALAIHGDTVMALGSSSDVRALAGPYTQQMNLEDAAVLPGAYDAWIDLEALGRWSDGQLDLRVASSVEEAQAMVRNAAGAAPDGDDWLVGWGWDENDWPTPRMPDHEALDATGVGRPIALIHRNGRAAWLNGAALEALPAGQLEEVRGALRDDSGAPTGILVGEALAVLREPLAADPEQRREWVAEGARRAAAAGITRAATAPVERGVVNALLELEFRGLLPLRVDVRLTPQAAGAPPGRGRRLENSSLVRIAAVGVRLDGPLASRLALLSEPYASGGLELPALDEDALQAAASAARDAGLPLHLHASGDAAVQTALELLRAGGADDTLVAGFDLLPAGPLADLSGVQLALPAARFARDVYWLDRVLGPARADRAHAYADLAAAGATLRMASDAPAYPPNPVRAVAVAATRQDAEGYPAGGWHPQQALPRAALLRAMVGAAAGLSAGDPADLVVWSEDPVAGDPSALQRAEALLTIVAGRVAYSRALVEPPMSTGQRR